MSMENNHQDKPQSNPDLSNDDNSLAQALDKLAKEGIVGESEFKPGVNIKKAGSNAENGLLVKPEVIDQLHEHYDAESWQRAHELTQVLTALADQQDLYNIPNEKQADRASEALKNCDLSPESIRTLEILNSHIAYLCRDQLPLLLPDFISDAERDSLRDPANEQFGLKPLEQQMRYLLARFITEQNSSFSKVDSDLKHDGEYYKSKLTEAVSYYVKAINVDVPMYDRLYEDFDLLRLDEKNKPLEVYLGRDGILAYIGRRSSSAVRAAVLDPAQRRQMRESGEIYEIKPRYTYFVYNRKIMAAGKEDPSADAIYRGGKYTRENSPEKKTKQEYIAQAGINASENPHFYDTGYRGSIPEDIMDLMGFSEGEIDRRIHMLSNAPFGESNHPRRRVRTLDKNYSDNVMVMENAPKPERSALGLRTNEAGVLEHVSDAVDPREQMQYLFMREAIHRHYWIREQLVQQGKHGS